MNMFYCKIVVPYLISICCREPIHDLIALKITKIEKLNSDKAHLMHILNAISIRSLVSLKLKKSLEIEDFQFENLP